MADIAAVFHWPLDKLESMEVDELFRWQRLAVARWNAMNGKGK